MMIWILAVGCALASLIETGFAQTTDSKNWEIEVTPEVSYYRYRESGVEDKGMMVGVAGSYIQFNGSLFTKIEGRFSGGKVDYEGNLMDNTPYTIENINDTICSFRVLMGQEVLVYDQRYRFYTGLGYRYLNDDPSFDPHAYQRESNYLYLPVGLWNSHALGQGWDLAITGEIDPLLYGRQFSHFGGVIGTVKNTQKLGVGLRASVELGYDVGSLELGFAPFIRYWWIDKSDVDKGFYEPRNNTLEYGVGLLVRY